MLVELHVRDLGVIEYALIEIGPGMTALTGETGAGKTLVVEGLELLLGGRADGMLVRPGADEALVEGRFLADDEELILARAVPAQGRSRAWVDGRMAPVAALGESGASLVELHGQHAHQSLFDPVAQRRALDGFAHIDLGPLQHLYGERRRLQSELSGLGGDERARAREVDLLRFQLSEIDAAHLTGPEEDGELEAEEDRLAHASALRAAAASALSALDSDSDAGARTAAGAVDRVGDAVSTLSAHGPLAELSERLTALQVELSDVASSLRDVVEQWEDDPVRLEEVRSRRQLLHDLAHKYGEGVTEVLVYAEKARERLDDLESAEERAAAVTGDLGRIEEEIVQAEKAVGEARRRAAPALGRAVEERLGNLAMPRARLEVQVGEDRAGDEVTFMLGANPGEPVLPLSKVASGGELARTMLALRLVLSEAPPTMVFDEVDAGIGGEAASSVGRALAEVAAGRQVLVVTHLAQVAAFADQQLVVSKTVEGERTVASVAAVTGEQREVELARMLSGSPGSATARRHARELLEAARRP